MLHSDEAGAILLFKIIIIIIIILEAVPFCHSMLSEDLSEVNIEFNIYTIQSPPTSHKHNYKNFREFYKKETKPVSKTLFFSIIDHLEFVCHILKEIAMIMVNKKTP